MKYKNVYAFRGIKDLICEEDGSFYYKEKLIHKRYRVGQIYLQLDKKRYGINTLRKLAYKIKIKVYDLPF